MRGVFSNANDINLFLMIFPRMSLHSKLIPVLYREYGINLFLMIVPRMSLHCMLVPVQYREYDINLFSMIFLPHEPQLQASSSPKPGIRIRSLHFYQERYIISCLLGILLHLYSHIILFIFHLIITLSESRNVVAIYFFKVFSTFNQQQFFCNPFNIKLHGKPLVLRK